MPLFSSSQMESGVTVPPFHPNCRGTTVPVIDEEIWGAGERAARDAVTGETYYVPENMTYEEWKKTFVKSPTPKGVDVTDEYKKTARPGKGQIVVEEDVEKEDVNMARLLHNFFGGDITVLRPINKQNQKTPGGTANCGTLRRCLQRKRQILPYSEVSNR